MIDFGNRLSGRVAFAPHPSPFLPRSGRPFSSILWSFQAIQEPFGLLYASITSPRKGRARKRECLGSCCGYHGRFGRRESEAKDRHGWTQEGGWQPTVEGEQAQGIS